MKVLHVIPSVSLIRGGTSQAVLDMVSALRTQGIDAEIATTNDDGNNILDVPLEQRVIHHGVPTYFFSRFSPSIHTIQEFVFSGSLTTWLLKNIDNYDLIHVHTLFVYSSTAAMTIARLKGIPYLLTPHGMLCSWSLQQSSLRKQIYLQLIERLNLDHSKFIHLTCQQEQQEISSLNFKSPTCVVSLALNTIPQLISNAPVLLRQSLNIPLDEPIILFLSRLHPKKGLDYLIPALGKLLHHKFTFIIAGNGTPEYEAEINLSLLAAEIRDRTHLTGFVAGEAKDLLLQGADLFTLTSHSENFGIAVLEALAVGLPVLLTPGVALSSVIEENKLGYVCEMDISVISQSIEQHLLNRSDDTRIASRSLLRQFTQENYTWNKITKDLIDIYKCMLSDSSGVC
jgi:glycosyltransferase involved in cell wall biosynthesis